MKFQSKKIDGLNAPLAMALLPKAITSLKGFSDRNFRSIDMGSLWSIINEFGRIVDKRNKKKSTNILVRSIGN